jgi:hypothetical protein
MLVEAETTNYNLFWFAQPTQSANMHRVSYNK